MPSKKLKRKTFFDIEEHIVFSYYKVLKEELNEFELFLQKVEKTEIQIEDYFGNFIQNIYIIKKQNSIVLDDFESESDFSSSHYNSSISSKSVNKIGKYVFGKNYFRQFIQEKIRNYFLTPEQFELKNILNF